ncbi:hypothetical protein Tco_0217038 [Tanacetum coccineum]
MDLEATDASSQQKPEQMDEEFTTTAYPNVQENLKLPTKDQVILEEPASSTRTLSSLQNLDKDLSFTDQFFMEKPHEEESGKMNAKTEVQSMVSVPIHQDTSSVPPMTTLVIDLTMMQSDSPLPTSIATISTIPTTITTLPPPPLQPTTKPAYLIFSEVQSQAVDEIVTDAKSLKLDYSNQHLADQEEARKKKRKKRAALRTPFGSPPSPPPPPPPLAGASGAPGISRTSRSSQFPPPPPPPSTSASGSAQQTGSEAPSSSKPVASTHQSMAWTTSDTRFESTDYTVAQDLSPTDSLVQDDSIPDEQKGKTATSKPAWNILYSKVSYVRNNWLLALGSTSETPAETTCLHKTGDMATFMKWYCRQVNKTKLTQADFEEQAYEVVKAFYPNSIEIWHKGSNPALSISKMKAASYPDFALELLVPEQMWIDDVCTYDISAKYGISYWWFNRQKFYIDRHDSPSRRKDVRTHIRILSVIRIKAYSRYRHDYLSKIVLRRADFQEHTIAERYFKKNG